MFALSEQLMAFIRSPKGVLQNYELPVAVCGTFAFSFIRPVNGRSLSADTLVGSQEFTTEGDDGAVTITGDNFLHRYQILQRTLSERERASSTKIIGVSVCNAILPKIIFF